MKEPQQPLHKDRLRRRARAEAGQGCTSNCRIARRSIRAAVWLRSLEVFFCVSTSRCGKNEEVANAEIPATGTVRRAVRYTDHVSVPSEKDLGVQYFIFLYTEI